MSRFSPDDEPSTVPNPQGRRDADSRRDDQLAADLFAGNHGIAGDRSDPGMGAEPPLQLTTLAAASAENSDRRKGSWLKTVFALALSLGILIGGGYFVFHQGKQLYQSIIGAADYAGPGEKTVRVAIPVGSSSDKIGTILKASDVIASTKVWTKTVKADPVTAKRIQAGDYDLKTKMSCAGALTYLSNPANVVKLQVTIPEGLRNTEIFAKINKEVPAISLDSLNQLATAPTGLNLPSWAKNATEGLLYPQTYSYDTSPTAVEMLGQMTAQFNKVTADLQFEQKAAALGKSPYEVLIVASIIEKETRDPKYGPDMAQVLYNRLAKGMPLQLDSTVIYANNSSGSLTTTDAQRAIDSPYNTYTHGGLPPGPISNPGKNSLTSALSPTQGDLLYWVATNPATGETKFASNYTDHQKNVAQFQAWCQANPGKC